MELIFNYIDNNIISQINIPKYGLDNNVACELSIPMYLVSQNKKIVVCLPDDSSFKLNHEYIKSYYPSIRSGYADIKNVSYNLSTQINYITSKYLRYKILKYYQDNTKSENFADVIIMLNPDINNENNIFIISSFKYAYDNNILLPRLCILNSEYSYKLSKNCFSIQNNKIEPKCTHIYENNASSIINNITEIVQSNYYNNYSDLLINVSNLYTAELINSHLKSSSSDYKILIISNDQSNTVNTFTDLFNIKFKKIIIAINLCDFHFENIGLVINWLQSSNKQNQPKVLGYNLPNEYYSFKENDLKVKIIDKQDYIKNLSYLVIDYVKCDITLNKLSFDNNQSLNSEIKKIYNLMKNLNLLIDNNNRLIVSPIGFFSQKFKLIPRKASFMWEWISKDYPIYQGIVMISLIDEMHSVLISGKSQFKWISKSPMHTYLNMFKSFSLSNKKELDNIIKNNDKSAIFICKKWADNNKISRGIFLPLISNISILYNNISKEMRNIDITITDFNVQNLINLAIPILKKVYLETVLLVKNNIIIQPHDNVKYVLNRNAHKNNLKDEKIIPLILRSLKNETISIDNFITI